MVKDSRVSGWTKRSELTLGYSAAAESCTGLHAPLRQLTSVQLTAWGPGDPPASPSVVLPATTFSYGPLEYTHSTTPSPGRESC